MCIQRIIHLYGLYTCYGVKKSMPILVPVTLIFTNFIFYAQRGQSH